MEFFDYADWIADGRRAALAKGSPDLDTERLFLDAGADGIFIYYSVELKTVRFETVVASFTPKQFSARFFNMLSVEGQV